MSSCELYEIYKNIFSYRTPPMAVSVWIIQTTERENKQDQQ